jgi:TolB-like protein/Flp pilus assembly protein TadD
MADRVEADKPRGTTDAEQAAQVFISYASQDKGVADAVCQALERAGVACWIAPRNVVPGESYAGAIVHAIDGTKLIVLILSERGASSQHVLREVERASSKRHPVVAFRIDAAPMPADFEYFLNTSQWLDASSMGVESALPRLVDAVQRAIASPAQAGVALGPTASPSQQTPVLQPASRGPGFLVLASGVMVALGLAYLAMDKLWLANHSTTDQPTTAATTAVNEKSVAVLPFTDMSEKHDQEYFGDGMAEEIIDLLAKVPGLTVIGRTSSFQFKGKNEDLRTIGTKLNAAYVLEGSVRNSGEQVRITAQLINTRTGAHEWSEAYDRHFGDVLKLQDAIALAVARELQLTVIPADLDSRAALKNIEAYGLMLRGRHAFDRLNKEGNDEAASLFQQALNRDPTLGDAASWLGRVYEVQGESGFVSPGLAFEQSRRMAELALKLDPRSAEAHALLANIHIFYDWDWAAAEREIQQAKSIAPGDPYVQRAGAILSMVLGRWEDALKQIKAAVVIDPLDPINYVYMWQIQDRIGQLSEAEASVRRILDIRPTYSYGHSSLGYLLLERGDLDGALNEVQRETVRGEKQLGMALVLYALGRKAESDAALAGYIKENAGTYASSIADIYALRGQSDEAMRWLERAFTQKDAGLTLIKADTALVPLNGDPRFKALLRKMNLPE